MNKKPLLMLIPMVLLTSCGSSSTSTPKVPIVTASTGGSSDTGSTTDTGSNVITGNVSVPTPDTDGAKEITLEEARTLANVMSEYQNSDLFKLPNELDMKMVTKGTTDSGFEGDDYLNSTERSIYSASNDYFRTESISSSNTIKNWKYIGNNPSYSGGSSSRQYYIEATLNNDEGTYTKEQVSTSQQATYQKKIYDSYNDTCFQALTGSQMLGNIDGEDENVTIDCKYYTKGMGSLIVTGTIIANNYKVEFGDVSFTGSMKSAVSYVWDNYLITSGQTDSLYEITVLFKKVKGSLSTTQTVTQTVKASDCTKPNYSNFTDVTDGGY